MQLKYRGESVVTTPQLHSTKPKRMFWAELQIDSPLQSSGKLQFQYNISHFLEDFFSNLKTKIKKCNQEN